MRTEIDAIAKALPEFASLSLKELRSLLKEYRGNEDIERLVLEVQFSRGVTNELYALHAPEIECLAKGKIRIPYEFGVKVSITTTHKEKLVVGARSMPSNPYDGTRWLKVGACWEF